VKLNLSWLLVLAPVLAGCRTRRRVLLWCGPRRRWTGRRTGV